MSGMHRVRALVVSSLVIAASACASPPTYRVHHKLLDGSVPPPQRVVLLPADVNIFRLSTSSIDSVPELSHRASDEVGSIIATELPVKGLELVSLPQLSESEQDVVTEHVLFFGAAADASLPTPLDVGTDSKDLDAWWHKIEHFDLCLGPGLSFLKERTGCSTAVMIAGAAAESTGGRKVATFFGTLFGGMYAPTSATDLFLGFVDLETGDLLWVGEHSDTGDWMADADALSKREDLKKIVHGLLERYPGLAEYREDSKRD